MESKVSSVSIALQKCGTLGHARQYCRRAGDDPKLTALRDVFRQRRHDHQARPVSALVIANGWAVLRHDVSGAASWLVAHAVAWAIALLQSRER